MTSANGVVVYLWWCDFAWHAINAVGPPQKAVSSKLKCSIQARRFHGSARRLERLVQALRRSGGETDHVPAWTT